MSTVNNCEVYHRINTLMDTLHDWLQSYLINLNFECGLSE